MNRRGLALIELLFGIVVVWLTVWLTNTLSTILEIQLIVASAIIVFGYVVAVQFYNLLSKSKKPKPIDNNQTPAEYCSITDFYKSLNPSHQRPPRLWKLRKE